MQIEYKKLKEIKPYEKNPRNNDGAVEAVANSINEFGFKVPIVIDKDGVIVAGHTRYKASKHLGLKEVPCIIADDLTDDQIKAFRLADNKTGELAEWDLDLLELELEDIDLDMSAFGFEFDESPTEAEEDNFEVILPKEPKARYGQIYQLGRHRVMCGDSTNPVDVENLAGGVLMDLCITDPPYNVNYTQYKNEGLEEIQILNDNMEDEQFFHFLMDFYVQMLEVLKPGAPYYIWHADSEGYNFRSALKAAGGQLKQTLIWVKNSLVLGRQDYQWQHEPCLYGWKQGAGHYFTSERDHTTLYDETVKLKDMKKDELLTLCQNLLNDKPTSIIRENKPKKNDLHPTMKPIKLMGYIMQNSSKQNDNVIDFFGGSGSTLIAAEQLNRNCYMMEMDPAYVDVIIERWEAFTGKKAVLISEI